MSGAARIDGERLGQGASLEDAETVLDAPESTCWFCGEPGDLSEEDFYPKWSRKVYPIDRSDKALRFAYGFIVHEDLKAAGTQVLPDVCSSCNNQWMSVVQNDASRHLKLLVAGKRTSGIADHSEQIARWCFMTSVSIEGSFKDSQVLDHDVRAMFARSRNVPQEFAAYIGLTKWPMNRGHLHVLFDHPYSDTGGSIAVMQLGKFVMMSIYAHAKFISELPRLSRYGLFRIGRELTNFEDITARRIPFSHHPRNLPRLIAGGGVKELGVMLHGMPV